MQKKVLAALEKCYAVAPLTFQGRLHILVAAERQARCLLFEADGTLKAEITEGAGGVMTMAQIPGSDGVYLTTNRFYSPDEAQDACIMLASPAENGGWHYRALARIPFLHRFDIFTYQGKNYIFACALKSGAEHPDDWSYPGKIYIGELPDDLSAYGEEHPLPLSVLKDGLFKNHGYARIPDEKGGGALICCENGVFRFMPPDEEHGEWREELLLQEAASDGVLADIDGDGEDELLILAPFHGDTLRIYKKSDGIYRQVFEFPERMPFLHAIWACRIHGKETVVVGYRSGARRLLAFYYDEQKRKYAFRTLDDDCGPANAYGYFYDGHDRVISANRETDEVAMYVF